MHTGEHMWNVEKCHGRPELPRPFTQKKTARQPKGELAVFIRYYRSTAVALPFDLSNLVRQLETYRVSSCQLESMHILIQL